MTASGPPQSRPPLPGLRRDLIVEPRPGGLVQVTAPGARQGFLMYELEFALARLFDGKRNPDAILRGAGEMGVAATPESMSKFFRQLHHYGFLEAAPVDKSSWPRTVSSSEGFAQRDGVLKLWQEGKHEEALSYLEMLVSQNAEDEGLLQLHELLRRQLLSDEQKQPPAQSEALGAAPAPLDTSPAAPAQPSEHESDRDGLLREVIEQGPEAVGRRKRRAWLRRLSSLGLVGAIGAAMVLVQCNDRVTEPCELTPRSRALVRTLVDSTVEKVLVEEGQAVKRGDLLVKLSDFEFKRKLDRIDAQLAKARAEREILLKGARPAELSRAKQLLASKYREVTMASQRRARLQALLDQQLASAEDLENASTDVASKEAGFTEAKAQLTLLTQSAAPEELAKRDAEIRSVEAERALALPSIEATELRSPLDGVVVTPRLQQKVGSVVSSGSTVVEVVDLEKMVAEIYVPQAKVDLLQIGAAVRVKVANLPSRLFDGKVTFIGFAVEKRGEPLAEYVRVESELDNSQRLLRPQVTGYAEIDVGRYPLGVLLFRGLARWLRYRLVI